ncbi:MAG TPA: hypothetical protein VHV52_11195 [Gaiellaceae bacterium]|jgi:hypothetical protein|nr:hypothetical protein [Gaiellaceae bacterium]
MAGVVKLTEAASELEAAEICGYLATHGIEATYDKGGIAQPGLGGPGEAFVGRQEILVRADDAERAAALLRDLRS